MLLLLILKLSKSDCRGVGCVLSLKQVELRLLSFLEVVKVENV